MNYGDESALQMSRFCSDWFNEPSIIQNNYVESRRKMWEKPLTETIWN